MHYNFFHHKTHVCVVIKGLFVNLTSVKWKIRLYWVSYYSEEHLAGTEL